MTYHERLRDFFFNKRRRIFDFLAAQSSSRSLVVGPLVCLSVGPSVRHTSPYQNVGVQSNNTAYSSPNIKF